MSECIKPIEIYNYSTGTGENLVQENLLKRVLHQEQQFPENFGVI